MAFENGVVELVGLCNDGVEHQGGFTECGEAGEEGNELGLDEGLVVKLVLDDLGEDLAELSGARAEFQERKRFGRHRRGLLRMRKREARRRREGFQRGRHS